MLRSGTVKNVLFVVMVASTYLTIRSVTYFSHIVQLKLYYSAVVEAIKNFVIIEKFGSFE